MTDHIKHFPTFEEVHEVPSVQVYRRGNGAMANDWVASMTMFGSSYDFDIGEVRAFGATFDWSIHHFIHILKQLGYRGTVSVEGLEGERYGELYLYGEKPRFRMFWQVDWSNTTDWRY